MTPTARAFRHWRSMWDRNPDWRPTRDDVEIVLLPYIADLEQQLGKEASTGRRMTPRWTAHTEDGAGLSLVKENGHLLIEVYGHRHPSLAREVAAAMNGEHP